MRGRERDRLASTAGAPCLFFSWMAACYPLTQWSRFIPRSIHVGQHNTPLSPRKHPRFRVGLTGRLAQLPIGCLFVQLIPHVLDI